MKSSNAISYKLLLMLALILSFFSCRTSPTGPHITGNVQLSADYVTCTEVWLKVSFDDTLGGNFAINRDGNTVLMGHFSGADTTVVDTTALPGRTYDYVCWEMVNGEPKEESSNLQVRTMDTTSHNFTWQSFTFGETGSALEDVAIINDSLIYAVGEIYLKDSTGQVDQTPYGVAVWNGQQWSLRRVYAYSQQGFLENIRPITGICAFSATDIWLADGNAYHWDGRDSILTAYWISGYPGNPNPVLGPNQGVGKLWGTSDENIYAGGANGGIAHYDGSVWEKIESGTNSNFQNIWGSSGKVIAITYESKVLTISGNTVQDTLNWSGSTLRGIWFGDNTPIYVSGVGVWKNELGVWREMDGLPYYYFTGIRGNGVNDLFTVGWSGMAAHYNGSTWHIYNEVANPAWDFESLAVNGDVTAMVGFEASGAVVGRALVIIGKR